MEIITSANNNNNNNNTHTSAKSPEPDTETPTRIHQPATNTNTKPVSFSNGVLKRHNHPLHHHHQYHANQPATVTYKECLKNHVASAGGHALDGCGEFMPSPMATADDPTSIKCAACGCHRNFHRREPEEQPISPVTHHHVLEYQPHHRHHPPPPHPPHRSPNSASPPPISSYPSAPHMLLALSGGGGLPIPPENTAAPMSTAGRKRFRTKFTQEQKEKMLEFAEKVGWKMQKRDEEMVMEVCNEVGVDRGVLKVWMHNNKNTFGKKDNNNVVNANGVAGGVSVGNVSVLNSGINGNGNVNENSNNNNNVNLGSEDPNQYENDSGTNVGTNGSSSSS